MPRDGANIYNLPFPDVVSGTPVASAVYNGFTHDVAQDLNTPRPIVAGGTGATSADGALAALSGEKNNQIVTNYDSQVWISGSFSSATTATNEPVDGHAFSGIVYVSDSNNIVVEARDATDGKKYIRRKVAGSWGSWALDSASSDAAIALKADINSPTFTGDPKAPTPSPGDNDTSIATTAFVTAATAANLVSPTFTGDPKAPTPTAGDNDTSIATTAFVATAVTGLIKTVKTQKFTASGTYTPSAGMTFCVIECVGGGGGGGGCGGGASQSYTGGGGGSGGYSRLTALAATIGASKAVTIGAAGTGGGAGANNGTIGGDTSVGALCIGKAGLGGICGSSALVPSGGDGGPPGTGDIAAAGMPGNPGFYNTANAAATITASGAGGSSFFGGGAVGIWGGTSSAGNAARAYGSGGSGGSVSGANNAAGGNGSAGFVHITEYCTQ